MTPRRTLLAPCVAFALTVVLAPLWAAAQTPWNPLPASMAPALPPPPPPGSAPYNPQWPPGAINDNTLGNPAAGKPPAPPVPVRETEYSLRALLGGGMSHMGELNFSGSGHVGGAPASFNATGAALGYREPWTMMGAVEGQLLHRYLLLGLHVGIQGPMQTDLATTLNVGRPFGLEFMAQIGFASRSRPVDFHVYAQAGLGHYGATLNTFDASTCNTTTRGVTTYSSCRPQAAANFFQVDVVMELQVRVTRNATVGPWAALELLPGLAPRFGVSGSMYFS